MKRALRKKEKSPFKTTENYLHKDSSAIHIGILHAKEGCKVKMTWNNEINSFYRKEKYYNVQ